MTTPNANLTPKDLQMFAQLGITEQLLGVARVVRVTDREARDVYGIKATGDMAGVIFPYMDPVTGQRYTARLRRDHPELEDGKPKGKYISAYGDRRHLYFVPGCDELVRDSSVAVLLVEAEKSALAITSWAGRMGRKVLPVAMGGCWGWRGRIGKKEGPDGERRDEKGPLPDLAICSSGREVFVVLDANADSKAEVRAARSALVRQLLGYGARVRIANIPPIEGVNGPDDLVARCGDTAIQSILELAVPALEVAVAESEAAIEAVGKGSPNPGVDEMRLAMDAIADVPDELQREVLEGRLAAAVRGVVSKRVVVDEVTGRRNCRERKRAEFAQQSREAELRSRPINAAKLVDDVEAFLAERLHLPSGAALLLAYFALNTWTFNVFDTVPYLSLESAVPGCGKSTVVRLLEAVSCRSCKATSLSEAVMFRLIDTETPTLLVDEAETIEGRSERAEALRAIAHEGYKKGGRVARCEGEDHEVRWFDVFCPKVFAAIGGVSGALLDRCLVIHMEKAPKGSIRKSTRHRALQRDARVLVAQLEAYGLQVSDALRQQYETEPDCGYWPAITDREAELWGPLLIHARLAGPEAEAKLLTVVDRFGQQKAEIQSTDWRISQTIELLEAVTKHPDATFTPGDLVATLAESEAWAKTLAEVKGRDEDSVRVAKAAKIGFFLRKFRLRGKKNSTGHMAYDRQATVTCLSAHVPQNPPNPTEPPAQNPPLAQASENKCLPDSTESTEGFDFQSNETSSGASGTSVPVPVAQVAEVTAGTNATNPETEDILSETVLADVTGCLRGFGKEPVAVLSTNPKGLIPPDILEGAL
jgi:hypothetical protein